MQLNRKTRSYLKKSFLTLSAGFFLFLIFFPFYWQIVTSFKPPEQLWAIPPEWWPSRFYTGYYEFAFTTSPFFIYLKNSAIIASASTFSAVVITSFAAYALARIKFRGRGLILTLVLSVSMFPGIAILSSLFLIMKNLQLTNTYIGLILTYSTITIPFATWNLSVFFKSIPRDLEEAAKIDGASPLYTYFHIILPLAIPGIFTVAILVFIQAWNEFMYALTFNTDNMMKTVTVGIAMFTGTGGQYDLPWGSIAAASIIVVLPLILIVLIFQRRIISGMMAGAIKA